MDKTCEHCEHWREGETKARSIPKKFGLGSCCKVKQFWEASSFDWNEEEGQVEYKLEERFKDDNAFVQDGSDYLAELITTKNFGCTQFNQKEA